MKANEFTSMSKEQLTEKVAELKKDLFTLRFQLATGQLQNTMQITAVKRDIARAKTVLRKLDHLSIYLLIAGTYTPFCLVTLRGAWGWALFGIVWGLALIGMLQEIRPRSEARILSLVIYAVMGWVIVIATGPLLDHLEATGLVLLAAGGLLYTGGIVFYAFDDRFRHWHGIWHLFVIGGSLLHYLTIALYVI